MPEDKGYQDKKEFICTACGGTVLATKFASQKTIKCDDCKANNRPTDPSIVAGLDTKSQREKRVVIGSDTKELPCIECGKMVVVTKFASANKVVCNECKGIDGDNSPTYGNELRPIKVNLSKINRDVMPTIQEYNTIPSLITNPRLREVTCPACGKEHMRVLKILDWSEFGLVITYQCQHCMLMVQISEQCNHLLKPMKESDTYDYSGNQIVDLISPVKSSRMYMTIERLLRLCEEHNIPVNSIELPKYRYQESKPVPVGFAIDPLDRNISIVQDTIDMLDKAERIGEAIDVPEGVRNIIISDTLAKQISNKLKEMFKP